ncbi:MAG: transcriptional regulator NrdR [Candidatus Ornithospirochaeta sp.]|nr:transcriptional regulator NrdR [Candidatus Ornithospirochaeta sp.]
MNCPRCGSDKDKVLESRSNKEGTAIRRRRKCLGCGYRFTSYERIEEKPIIVIKKDGRHQPFDIKKVERGIRTCTEKLNIDQGQIERILRNIEDNIKEKADSKNMVSSREVGEETLKELYPISKVAYVRFASVYRAFDDLDQFIKEIEKIARESKA